MKYDPQDPILEETAPSTNAHSFMELALRPSVQAWKRKLYGLLAGESSEALSKLGIEQYIRVLLAESKDRSAQYCFSEAVAEVVQEWNSTVLESADRLSRILSLVAGFTPAVGFSKVLTHLERSENVKRSQERVSDEYDRVDLYKRGMLALAQYYPSPPFHSYDDLGFAAYRSLLERNLEDERYSGYAAVRLLELKVLNFKSKQFAALLLTEDKAATSVFQALLELAEEPREVPSVERRFGDMLVTCARADNIQRFERLAQMNRATFDPQGDYQVFFPTLRLSDGTVLEIRLDIDDIKDTPLHEFVKYTTIKVKELLRQETLNEDKIGRYVSGYIDEKINQREAMRDLFDALKALDANMRSSKNKFFVTVKRNNFPIEIKLRVKGEIQEELMKWILTRPALVIQFPFPVASAAA